MTRVQRARRRASTEPDLKLLLVTSSPCARDAAPLRIGRRLAEGLVATRPDGALVVRDLDRPPRVFSAAAPGARSPRSAAARAAAMARAGAYLDELCEADVVILAVTNPSLTASLKRWFERVMLPGLTFACRDGRVEGLLQGKKVYVVFGGSRDDPGPTSPEDDFHEEYLRLMFRIMGMTDVEVIRTDDDSASLAWNKVAAIVGEQPLTARARTTSTPGPDAPQPRGA